MEYRVITNRKSSNKVHPTISEIYFITATSGKKAVEVVKGNMRYYGEKVSEVAVWKNVWKNINVKIK